MTKQTSNKPTHRAFYVTGEGDNRRWHELGAAWSHKDGKGFNILPLVLPAPGQTIVLRPITDKSENTPRDEGGYA